LIQIKKQVTALFSCRISTCGLSNHRQYCARRRLSRHQCDHRSV